jgi:hypothetical protein
MRRLAWTLALLATWGPAQAVDVDKAVVTWTNATNVPLTGTRVEWNDCTTLWVWSAALPVVTTYTVTGLMPGTHCFRVFDVSAAGDSLPSAVVSKISPAVWGDIDGNGIINTVDYSLFRSVMNRPSGFSAIALASDLDRSGIVNTVDYSIFRSLINQPPKPWPP